MATVEVEVDLNQIELDDLVFEIIFRIHKKNINAQERGLFLKLKSELNNPYIPPIKNSSKINDWKDELLAEVKEKFTLEQIEALLPDKYIRK